jgi:hypothetical protein
MTIAETGCAAKLVLRIEIEITRLAAVKHLITLHNSNPEYSFI